MTQRLPSTVTRATALVAFIGLIGAGVWALNGRYARAEALRDLKHDIRVQIAEVKVFVLESRRDAAQRELLELDRAARSRPQTDLDQTRARQLRIDLEKIDHQIDRLQQGGGR